MRASVLLAAGLLLAAGCLSPGSEEPGGEAGPDASEEGPATAWQTVDRSGTVTGVGTPAGSVSQGGGNTATWTVPADTRIMYLNLTAEGGQLSVEYGPDCTTEDTVECEHSATTEDGEIRLVHETPNATGWEAYLFLENDAGEVDWQLVADMGVRQR